MDNLSTFVFKANNSTMRTQKCLTLFCLLFGIIASANAYVERDLLQKAADISELKSVLLMDRISAKRAIIAPRASMTVHPVRMTGLVVGAPQTYHYFDQIQDHIVDFVTENSRISREDFERYMMATGNMATDVGTVLYGAEAVKSGLMDELGTLSDALSYLHRQIARGKKRRGESNGETNG